MSQVDENHCCDAQMPENTTQNEQENVDEGFDALTKQLLTDLKQEFGDKMPDKHLFKQTAKFERKSDIFNKKKTEKFRRYACAVVDQLLKESTDLQQLYDKDKELNEILDNFLKNLSKTQSELAISIQGKARMTALTNTLTEDLDHLEKMFKTLEDNQEVISNIPQEIEELTKVFKELVND